MLVATSTAVERLLKGRLGHELVGPLAETALDLTLLSEILRGIEDTVQESSAFAKKRKPNFQAR